MPDLLPQNRATIPGSSPDEVPVDPKVRVNQNVTEGDDLWPRHLGVASPHFLGDSRGCLADNGEFLNYGAAEHLRFLKHLEIGTCDELSNVVRSLYEIRAIQALMPHTRAAPLP